MDSTSTNQEQQPIDVLENLLGQRFSCRAFLPEPVPRATIERILAAAQKTASWCNSQPWRLEITSGEATEKFRNAMVRAATNGQPRSTDFPVPREYRGAYLERRRESGFQLYNSLGIARGDTDAHARQELANFNFFGAPHVAIVHTDQALGVYGAIDCGGYVTSFVLAAQALGVATIPAGRAGIPLRCRAQPFRHRRRAATGVRHLVRIPGPRAQGERLSHWSCF
jgi:nitroreductase